MAFTDLEEVWCADIVGTDQRVQADGKWLPSFPEDRHGPQNIVFSPIVSVPAEGAPLPSVSIRRGTRAYPNGNPGVSVYLGSVWTAYDTPAVESLGMWPPSNIGWAPSPPVLSPLTDQFASPIRSRPPLRLTADNGNSQLVFQVTRSAGYSLSLLRGAAAFADSEADRTRMWVFTRGETVVFAHFATTTGRGRPVRGRLSMGVFGITWLPAGSVHNWDMFQGQPVSGVVSATDDKGDEVTGTITLAPSNEMITQGLPDAGHSIDFDRFRVMVGNFQADKEGVLWWASVDVPEGHAIAPLLDSNDTVSLTLTWEYMPVGEAGPDMIGGN